jgi:putative Holliday junction resolvase
MMTVTVTSISTLRIFFRLHPQQVHPAPHSAVLSIFIGADLADVFLAGFLLLTTMSFSLVYLLFTLSLGYNIYRTEHFWSIALVIATFKTIKEKFDGTDVRLMGLDYGSKRVGAAISDVSRRIASPYRVLAASPRRNLFLEIAGIAEREGVGAIILGLPLEMSGREGVMAGIVRGFGAELANAVPGVDIAFIDERLSSALSEKMLVREFGMSRAKRAGVLDKLAAREILQLALDLMGNME